MRLPLTDTALFLARTGGASVDERDGFTLISSPDNRWFYHGNYLLLPEAPSDLVGWRRRAQEAFLDVPEVAHVCLRWDGAPLSQPALLRAQALGFSDDSSISMTATTIHPPPATRFSIRRLDMHAERDAIIALNRACDITELGGDEKYVAFKEGIRRSWWRWADAGVGQWWGVLDGGELIAQCGIVRCPGGRARLQSVETHPAHRRQGACSALIAAAGLHALQEWGCQTVHLAADGDGPARALYRRLGFAEDGVQCCLLWGGDGLSVRPAVHGDHADIRSLTTSLAPDTLAAVLAGLKTPQAAVLVATRGGIMQGYRLDHREQSYIVVRPEQDLDAVRSALMTS